MKTSELQGNALNYVVGLIEGYEPRCAWMLEQRGWAAWQGYEQGWGVPISDYIRGKAGDDIIDRALVSTIYNPRTAKWSAWIYDAERSKEFHDPDRRTAAMRAWVQFKLGDTVELPKELEYEKS